MAARAKLALLGVATLIGLGACTAQQRAETARASQVFACEVAVLAPFVPDAIDLEKLVEDVVTGHANLAVTLARLGAAEAQANSAVDDFNTCFAGSQDLEPLPAELTGS